MKYGEILSKSWKYLKKYKFLWLLGVLAGNSLSTSFYGGTNTSFNGGELEKIQDVNPINNTSEIVSASVKSVGKVLGENVSDSFTDQPAFWGLIFIVIVLLLIIAIYLSITSKGALIFSINGLEEGKTADLKSSWLLGQKFFWRRISFALIVFLLYLLPLMILSIPVIVLAVFDLAIPAIIFSVLLGLIFLAYSIYLSLFLPYGERILYLEKKTAYKALKAGYKTFNRNWRELVLIYLIILGITFAVGIALMTGMAFIILVLGVISFILYSISAILGIIIGSIFALIVFVALLIVGGGLSAYTSSILTMVYRSIKS